jgi:hypothetical protein
MSFLPCFNNYTLFPAQIYAGVSPSNEIVYYDTYIEDCLSFCAGQVHCRGFNFNGTNLQCTLLLINTFSPQNLEEIGRDDIGFYMESNTLCSHQTSVIFYIIIIVITIILPICCYLVNCKNCLGSNPRHRSISQSQVSLLPSGRSPGSSVSVPPTYEESESSVTVDIPQTVPSVVGENESMCSSLRTNLSIRSEDL